MLSEKEKNRYKHHLKLPSFGLQAQEKLKSAGVLIVGMGGLGCPAAQYLVAAGVGTLGILDGDVVEESNLQRQVLYNEEDIGKFKVEAAQKHLQIINSSLKIKVHKEYLQNNNALEIFENYDVIVDATDNFEARYLINDACFILRKPNVFGAVLEFEGQVSVFNYNDGPTYRCLFPCPPEQSPRCEEIGVLGVVPGVIGTLQACEVIKIITGVGEVLSGKLLIWNGLTMQSKIFEFEKCENEETQNIQTKANFTNCKLRIHSSKHPFVKNITQDELIRILQNKEEVQIVDVRENEEIEQLPSNVFHWPLSEIHSAQLGNISGGLDKTKKTILYCCAGIRSQEAAWILEQKWGFHNAYSLAGGINDQLFPFLGNK